MPRRTGILAMIAFALFLCCGQATPAYGQLQFGNIGPSKGEIVGAGVAVGAIVVAVIVVVHIHNSHILKGCVVAGPNGRELRTGNGEKTYALSGGQDLKAGDLVKLHGTKVKKAKGDAEQAFTVEKLNKDYGPCKATPTP
jgi:hypothetical protein